MFPTTDRILGQFDRWMDAFTKPLLPLRTVPHANGDFHFEFTDRDARGVVVAKLVRLFSGIRAARALVDDGYVVESAALLRLVADFAIEVIAASEVVEKGEATTAQRKFITDFYAFVPTTSEDFLQAEKRRWVSRDDLTASITRMYNDVGEPSDKAIHLRRGLNAGFDGFVHGSYLTAMELFTANDERFQISGRRDQRRIEWAMIVIAGKLHEVLVSVAVAARAFSIREVFAEATAARRDLEASGEYSRTPAG